MVDDRLFPPVQYHVRYGCHLVLYHHFTKYMLNEGTAFGILTGARSKLEQAQEVVCII